MSDAKPTGSTHVQALVPNAMVLAAGLGRRMRHLSQTRPKPLTPLAGRTLLDRVLDRLTAAGVQDVVVNVHYMAEQIEHAVANRDSQRPRISISDERDDLLDTGGGVVRALPQLGPKPFFIHNSDSVWWQGLGDNLVDMARAWEAEQMDTLLMLAPTATAIGYDGRGDFLLDAGGQIQRRPEREDAPFVFTGVSLAHPRLFDDAPTGAFSLNWAWNRAIDANRAYGFRMSGVWMHVGTPEALAEAETLLRDDQQSHE
ncbi:MAG: nucleotidyltransferase family protein [Pseudomonadota bacterium]